MLPEQQALPTSRVASVRNKTGRLGFWDAVSTENVLIKISAAVEFCPGNV